MCSGNQLTANNKRRTFQTTIKGNVRNVWWKTSGNGVYKKTHVYTDHGDELLITNDGVMVVSHQEDLPIVAILMHYAFTTGMTPKEFVIDRKQLKVNFPDDRDITMCDKIVYKNGSVVINNMSNIDVDKGNVECVIYEKVTDHCW